MASNNNRKYEIDERAWEIIKSGVLELARFFQTPQDKKMFERKVSELFSRLRVDVREKVIVNGRADDTAGTGTTATANN